MEVEERKPELKRLRQNLDKDDADANLSFGKSVKEKIAEAKRKEQIQQAQRMAGGNDFLAKLNQYKAKKD